MLDKNGAIMQSLVKIVDVFGFDYVKEHRTAPCCYCEETDNIVIVTFLFQSEKDRPDITPDYLGWAVYATVCVNLITSEAAIIDGIMPNGTRIAEEQK